MDNVDKYRAVPRIDTVLKKKNAGSVHRPQDRLSVHKRAAALSYGDRGGGQTCDNDGGNHDGGVHDAGLLKVIQ